MLKKETTCAFTGHRPEKLNIKEEEAKRLLCLAIEKAIKRGYETFITGMAKGVDIWAAEIALEFKNIYPNIKLVCALPYPKFAQNAPHVIEKADYIHTISDNYSIFSYQQRNRWMVDASSLVISLYNGKKGGTQNTINYAKEKGVEVSDATKASYFKQISFEIK